MLQTLELINIRSYKNGLFEFKPSVNIIVGANASGKTNLLESIYMSAKGVGFKSGDLDMIARDEQWGRIDANFNDHKRTIKIKRKPTSKVFVVDDVEKKRLSGSLQMPLVLFEPGDMLLLGGEPERRRSYLDNLLSQTETGYSQTLKDYKRVLAQRNRLLKQENLIKDHLFVWDLRLSELGAKISETRAKYINYLQEQISENYQSVSGNNEILSISYETKFSHDSYAANMLAQLKIDFEKDRARGFSGAGPHRDDLRISINGNDARNNASRGETRSVILALKIAELKLLEKIYQKKPFLLLDDVFSELDGKRRRMLAATLSTHQTFITTTDADVVIEHFGKSCNIIPL